MPKMKSHSGMKKRVKVTSRGKLLTERANMQHKFLTKSSRKKRALSGTSAVSKADGPRVKRMLGI
ncbi:MAG: 50S ribosomal protein L35 [Jatrophihabitans sp.]